MPTDWDSKLETWAPVTGNYCGEFRYEGVINRLQFYMENNYDTDCVVYIVPRDAIMLGVRLEFTLAEFYDDGGIVSFVDRMAGVLGVHKADLKIVTIYEGSTIVKFQVVQRDDEEEGVELLDLKSVDAAYRNLIQSEEFFMGSRILEAEIEGVPILSPFETARQRDGLFDDRDFNDVVDGGSNGEGENSNNDNSQGSSTTDAIVIDTNIFGDKVTVREDGSQVIENEDGDMTIIDRSGKVTKMRTVVVETNVSATPMGDSYLIICIVVLVALVVILGAVFLTKKCKKKDIDPMVEVVQRERQFKAKTNDGDFDDLQG